MQPTYVPELAAQPPISAVMLTHNSERLLEKALESVKWCDEIVVVDSGSTDRTLEICASFGAKIFQKKLDRGFGEQKKFAVSKASHDWVLILDSDEIVKPELAREIQLLPLDGTVVGYKIHRQMFFLNHGLIFSGTQSDWQMRLFDRSVGNFNLSPVHEDVEFKSGETAKLEEEIEHYSYPNLEDYFAKLNRYTTLAAEELYREEQSGKRAPVSGFKMWAAFPVTFLKMYVFKLGILDGFHGFLCCFFSSVYPVVKYAKLLHLRNQLPSKIK